MFLYFIAVFFSNGSKVFAFIYGGKKEEEVEIGVGLE